MYCLRLLQQKYLKTIYTNFASSNHFSAELDKERKSKPMLSKQEKKLEVIRYVATAFLMTTFIAKQLALSPVYNQSSNTI